MNLDELKTWIDEAPCLRPHAAFLLDLAKPCVGIQITPETGLGLNSRLAGRPMVAPDFVWPAQAGRGPYRFLGQFNFAEVENAPAALPNAGLLTLFHSDWTDDGDYSHDLVAHFHTDLDGLRPYTGPLPLVGEGEGEGPEVRSRRIGFQVGVDIPHDRYMHKDWRLARRSAGKLFSGAGRCPRPQRAFAH